MSDMIKKGVHGCSQEDSYVVPADPLIRERLEWFRDQKLALMMHFGLYSQIGFCESWPLSEEASWARSEADWVDNIDDFRQQYVNLNKSFNPIRIQPEKWAEFAAENGFKYLIFTTKHHDGFCLFDTKYTDYKTTSPDCPFHTHKHANIAKSVFDAFRDKGLAIAAYFSKPDWNCPWYWAKDMDKPWGFDHNPTYNPSEHPELWEKYVEFTHNQMMELIEEYGRIDVLWLDGGQVNPANGQDIRLSELVKKARKIQPWLITADRTVGGENENYITPEQSIPDRIINVPWESCVTLGNKWGFSYDGIYKSSREIITMLIDVVSCGGNLALNIGPQPDGRLPEQAMKIVKGFGDWLKINGDAIYGTRATDTAQIGNVRYTKKGDTLYALLPLAEGEMLSETVFIPTEKKINQISCLGHDQPLSFENVEGGVVATLPSDLVGTDPYAVAFALT